MLSKIRKIAGIAAFCIFGSTHAGTFTGGATEITQLLNNLQLVLSYTTQLQSLETQTTNLLKQKDLFLTNPREMINSLANLVEDGQALGVGSARIAKKLEESYGSDYKKNAPYASGADFEGWMKTTKDSIRGAMKSVGMQQDDLATDADMIMSLRDMSNSSQGNLQVAQTGNQIGINLLIQFQKLRQMNMAQSSAMNAWLLAVQNKEERERAETQQFFGEQIKPMRSLTN